MKPHYIGITGITTKHEAESVSNSFLKNNIGTYQHLIPMIGVLVSYKTLKNETSLTYTRYPPLIEIPQILSNIMFTAFTTLHYNTRNPKFSTEIIDLLKYENIYDDKYVDGIQLNISNPSVDEIVKIKEIYPKLSVILQINRSFLREDDQNFIKRIQKYDEVCDHCLIDPSGGRGQEFDLYIAAHYYKLIKDNSKFRVGFAGGFSELNVGQRLIVLKRNLHTLEFSIDAEGRLRDHQDKLVLDKAHSYIAESIKALAVL